MSGVTLPRISVSIPIAANCRCDSCDARPVYTTDASDCSGWPDRYTIASNEYGARANPKFHISLLLERSVLMKRRTEPNCTDVTRVMSGEPLNRVPWHTGYPG
jgi:hypothetical protein